ncbi:unnamed protein product [Thelazia callipaeda]|uniref:Utp12 domain-containing protein n=1 Tax=Thelazia callipaeda TaxID=103827 RepID=A0A0N5D573_THECL|nr:unnamed protein product [Thelazia callipaeda]
MIRRSQRLSEAKETRLRCNGDIANNKSMKLDDSGIANHSNDAETITDNNKKKGNCKLSVKRSSAISLKDIPLKERRKMAEERNKCLIAFQDLNLMSTSGESMAVLLSQGLTSSDAEKVDSVLKKASSQTILATLNDLPATFIIPLLKEIEYRCRNRRYFDACWMQWLQCILSKHMAYLCTISTLKEDLSSLFDWISKRASRMNDLLQVNGKLSLINEQIDRRMCPQMFITQQPSISFEDDGDILSETSGETDGQIDEESIEDMEEWWNDDEFGSGGSEISSEESNRDGPEEGSDNRMDDSESGGGRTDDDEMEVD